MQLAARAPVAPWLVRHRRFVQAVTDASAWIVALWLVAWVRFEFSPADMPIAGLVAITPVAASAQVFGGVLGGLYLGRWRFGSFDEVAAVARTTVMTALLLVLLDAFILPGRPVPRSVLVVSPLAAFVFMGATRYGWRLALDRRRRPTGAGAERVLVLGAGEAGFQIVTSMLRDPDSRYLPVALLDDDPAKRNLRFLGVSVFGGTNRLAAARDRFNATSVLIAIPSAGAEVIRDVSAKAAEAELDVKVLPSVSELFGVVGVGDIRTVTEADLLGRHKIETDLASIAGYLTGKKVLVTGAGGSIGSELCRQISRFSPGELIMLDRDESALHGVQLSIEGRALLDTPNVVLGDIRDVPFLQDLFEKRRPDVVFHAAALKHLPMLEQYPGEAVKTNVWGTLNVLEAAAASGVDRFVNISTDKAADPTSVLGYSKRIAERLTAHIAGQVEGTYLSVRFGNVLGSRGSVLTTFRAQVEAGGPITVTHPDVTRFFMTVEEAVELVIQAGAVGRAGEALVLDMGEPVRIDDVAKRLAAEAVRPVSITYTGLRPGEKLHEVLLAKSEPDDRPIHPLISHARVQGLTPLIARQLNSQLSAGEVSGELERACCSADHGSLRR